MNEAECYARCYELRGAVRVLGRPGRREATLSGEQIRRLFERRLDSRLKEAA
jgi:hypothetical protein